MTDNDWYLRHFKIIFDIIPNIHVLNSTFFVPVNHDALEKSLSVIMENLNNYAIDYCSPPHYNYFMFYNLFGNEIGSRKDIYDKILQ